MLKRISKEEAQGLIKATEDYTDSSVQYYTITPSTSQRYKAEDGWEDVTYYTGRPSQLNFTPSIDKQYVYILTNDAMPGLVKIGYTKDDPNLRVKQLNASTGVAVDFTLEWAFGCYNAIELEQEVHKHLASFRLNTNREFFKISVDKAKTAIKMLGKRYNSEKDV